MMQHRAGCRKVLPREPLSLIFNKVWCERRWTYVKAIRRDLSTRHRVPAWCCCSDLSSAGEGGREGGLALLSCKREALSNGCNRFGGMNLNLSQANRQQAVAFCFFITSCLHACASSLFLIDSISASVSPGNNYMDRTGSKKHVGGNKHMGSWKLSTEKLHFLAGSIICTDVEVIISGLLITWALILLLRICGSQTAIQRSRYLPSTSPDTITPLEWREV